MVESVPVKSGPDKHLRVLRNTPLCVAIRLHPCWIAVFALTLMRSMAASRSCTFVRPDHSALARLPRPSPVPERQTSPSAFATC
jgi:hypothetical protein